MCWRLIIGWLLGGAAFALAPAYARDAEEKKPDLRKAEQQILDHLNAFRKEEKLAAVRTNPELQKAAGYFADFMARTDKYSHEADGKRPADRARDHGYDYCIVLENIAFQFNSAGFATDELAKGFHQGWVDSPGHRKNMLDPDVSDVGIAVARSASSGKYYAVQMFGRPKSAAIEFSIANRSGKQVRYTLDDERFDLPPSVTRTHTVCRPAELSLGGESVKVSTSVQYTIAGNPPRLQAE